MRPAGPLAAGVLLAVAGTLAWWSSGGRDQDAAAEAREPVPHTRDEGTSELELELDREPVGSEREAAPVAEPEAPTRSPETSAEAAETRCDLVAHVRVLDAESEEPLPEVELWLADVQGAPADADREARTDRDGRAAVRMASWVPARGELEHAGYGPVRFALLPTHAAPETALVLRLRRSAVLRGSVTGNAGLSISGASIELECYTAELVAGDTVLGSRSLELGSAKTSWHAATGADGRFEIAGLPAGVHLEASLIVRGDVRKEEPVRLRPGQVREVAYRVLPGARLRGVVVDADGAPCAVRGLWLVPGDESRMLRSRDEHADFVDTAQDGTFEFDDVRPGHWLVGPGEHSPFVSWMTHVEVPEGVSSVDAVVRLPRGLELSGRVVGPADEPVAGVLVTAGGGGNFARSTSREDGTFRITGLLAGAVTVGADSRRPGLVSSERVPSAAGATGVVVRLVDCAQLRVRVRDEAGRAVSAEVLGTRIDDPAGNTGIWYAWTDEAGVAEPAGLAPGLVRVLARVEGGAVGTAEPVRIDASGTAVLDVTVRAGGRVRVRAPDGAGRLHVFVGGLLVDHDPVQSGDVVTSKALPAGRATVEIVGTDASIRSREVAVTAGQTTDVAFD